MSKEKITATVMFYVEDGTPKGCLYNADVSNEKDMKLMLLSRALTASLEQFTDTNVSVSYAIAGLSYESIDSCRDED